MSITIKLFIFLLFISGSCLAQNTMNIKGEWINLKKQLERRNGIVDQLSITLKKSKKVDQVDLAKSKRFATELNRFIDTLHIFDSSSISTVYRLHVDLEQALGRVLITLERDSKFRNLESFRNLQMQLEGNENRITIAKIDYNKACEVNRRPDLYFGINDESHKE